MKTLSLRKISLTIKILYPLWMIIGMLALMYIPSLYYVSGNPIETATNIKSNEIIFRLGIVTNIFTQLLAVFIPILLYWLFKSISTTKAQLMIILNLIAIPIAMYGNVHLLESLELLDSPEQMMRHIKMSHFGITIAYVFWGLWLFPLGSLAITSGYFPKVIGYALYVGGIGYLFGAFTAIIFPEMSIISEVMEAFTIGEVIFILWFVIKGPKLSN